METRTHIISTIRTVWIPIKPDLTLWKDLERKQEPYVDKAENSGRVSLSFFSNLFNVVHFEKPILRHCSPQKLENRFERYAQFILTSFATQFLQSIKL